MPNRPYLLPTHSVGQPRPSRTAGCLACGLGHQAVHGTTAGPPARMVVPGGVVFLYSPKRMALRLEGGRSGNIVYLSPAATASSDIRSPAIGPSRAARQSTLPPSVTLVETGKRYPEGTAVRFSGDSDKDIAAIVKLTSIKRPTLSHRATGRILSPRPCSIGQRAVRYAPTKLL